MTHTITLEQHDGRWHARFSDPAFKQLMGTDLVPTPYLITFPLEKVIAELQKYGLDVDSKKEVYEP